MELKHAVMISMLGRMADRFHEYHPARSLEQLLAMAMQVEGMNGIEIVYPSHFHNTAETIQLIKESGIQLSALNLNVKDQEKWRSGSFTSPDKQIREQAVQELKIALDLAADLGTEMVTCCPLIDGHNYNFEVDYLNQWLWLEEGIREGAKHRNDIRLSLEYKLNESRNYNILADAGRALYLCEKVDLPHVGITLDIGHALIAKETPAEVLCLAAQANRLFYVHFNDNDRMWDWDMLPGSVNFWDLIEVVFYLDRLDWNGWLSYDIVTRNGDLVESMESGIALVEMSTELLDKIGREHLQQCINEAVPARTFKTLMERLL